MDVHNLTPPADFLSPASKPTDKHCRWCHLGCKEITTFISYRLMIDRSLTNEPALSFFSFNMTQTEKLSPKRKMFTENQRSLFP